MGTTFKNFIPEDRTNDEIVGKTFPLVLLDPRFACTR